MMEFTLAQVEFSLSYERIGIHSCSGYLVSQSILPVKVLLYRAKYNHLRWFGMCFGQVSVNGGSSNISQLIFWNFFCECLALV